MIKYKSGTNDTDFSLTPPRLVDLVWHSHILDTKAYGKDCKKIMGRFIHHIPTWIDVEDN